MFGVQDTPDTSGYGLLRVHRAPVLASPRPYGSYFDDVADELGRALEGAGFGFSDAIERVVADRGELTFYVRRERLPEVAAKFRDDPALRFELCTGVSRVHYPDETGRELHAVYHLLSITHNRRVRLEVTTPDADRHIPSLVGVYPANNWHERETWDLFGIIFDGHPGLTRIQMPDDWKGHPQREDPGSGRAEELLMTQAQPPHAAAGAADAEAAEGRVYTVSGEDWDEVVSAAIQSEDFEAGERNVINMGPQHPSTHGVLRLVLTLEGETVVEVRPAIGYLHTGIEKNMEYRTWTQGVTFCT